MIVIVDIDGSTGETEYTHEDEFEKWDLPAFITLSNREEQITSTTDRSSNNFYWNFFRARENDD